MVIQLLILVLLLLVIPVWVGSMFAFTYRGRGVFLFRWLSGHFLLWAGFQIISVFLILRQDDFGKLQILYGMYIAAMVLASAAAIIRQRIYGTDTRPIVKRMKKGRFSNLLLWLGVWSLLAFQLVQAVRMAYADGDDAYYVAMSAVTVDADSMYLKLPYTGGATGLDVRHGLAPFPMWIAFLAQVSGMRTVTLAQVCIPVVLLCMAYGIFYMLGSKLFPEKNGQLPLFLIFTEVLVLFGDYSFSTVENFMIARTQQGKAVLGSIVIPFLFLLFIMLLRRLQRNETVPVQFYLLVGAGALTGCLCSTLGALLVCMMIGVAGLLGALCYRRFKVLLPLALVCVPCICYALVYVIMG